MIGGLKYELPHTFNRIYNTDRPILSMSIKELGVVEPNR